MQALLGATRAEMGFVFGLATVTLTAGMNVAPRLYRRLSPVTLALGSGLTSGLGREAAAGPIGRRGSRVNALADTNAPRSRNRPVP